MPTPAISVFAVVESPPFCDEPFRECVLELEPLLVRDAALRERDAFVELRGFELPLVRDFELPLVRDLAVPFVRGFELPFVRDFELPLVVLDDRADDVVRC